MDERGGGGGRASMSIRLGWLAFKPGAQSVLRVGGQSVQGVPVGRLGTSIDDGRGRSEQGSIGSRSDSQPRDP